MGQTTTKYRAQRGGSSANEEVAMFTDFVGSEEGHAVFCNLYNEMTQEQKDAIVEALDGTDPTDFQEIGDYWSSNRNDDKAAQVIAQVKAKATFD